MIAVSGNLGSGKTTTTRALAQALNWSVEPQVPYNHGYIVDQLSDPQRWTLEAQLSFLSHKVRAVSQAIRRRESFILDRSVYEEIEVFGRYWASQGHMNDRAWSTYFGLAQLLLTDIPRPAAIINCAAPWQVCADRIGKRPRPYQQLYAPDHLRRLQDLHQNWLANFGQAPVLEIDTVAFDMRDSRNAQLIAEQVLALTASARSPYLGQAPLPWHDDAIDDQSPKNVLKISNSSPRNTGNPRVYIAASFSKQELPASATSDPNTIVHVHSNTGVLPSSYRRRLQSIARSFSKIGYEPILPHRDVNSWGRRTLTPQQVADRCLQLVVECDLFFGILGESYGSHAEAATALALKKPSILVALQDCPETFFGKGMRLSKSAASVTVPGLSHIPKLIESSNFKETLTRAGDLASVTHWA
ncbi:deoxynucleoside kinase [Streptomyces achmelvichensis]|uniref:deoxynucleoside kinase n=1 Tax=Streptomyces achmelvichensis TaxID=3134111 RepID=UPI003C12C29A